MGFHLLTDFLLLHGRSQKGDNQINARTLEGIFHPVLHKGCLTYAPILFWKILCLTRISLMHPGTLKHIPHDTCKTKCYTGVFWVKAVRLQWENMLHIQHVMSRGNLSNFNLVDTFGWISNSMFVCRQKTKSLKHGWFVQVKQRSKC